MKTPRVRAVRLRAALADPVRLRKVATWVALAVVAWSCVVSAFAGDNDAGPVLAAATPISVALSWRLPPRTRSWVFSGLAAVLALFVPDAIFMWPGLSALLVLALLDDPSPLPWVPWASAGAGAAASFVLYSSVASPAPFFAVVMGGVVGLLVRSVGRTGELEREAGALRGQTVWLEQRTHLARELHDVVGHHVTAMVVQAEAGLVDDPEQALRRIGTLGRTALGELDALVVHLRDPDSELAVAAPPRLGDIDELLVAPLRAQGVQVVVRVDDELRLDEVQVLAVYRIVQEALTNVARHAQASAASVEVLRVADRLRVRVSDDGVGTPATPERGSGLVGIGERVAAHGGFWELSDRLGGGTVLDVVLPLERDAP